MPASGRKNFPAGKQASMALAKLFLTHKKKTCIEVETELGIGTFSSSGRRSGRCWSRYVTGERTMRPGDRQRFYDKGKLLGLLPLPSVGEEPLTQLQKDCGQGLRRREGNLQQHVARSIQALEEFERAQADALRAVGVLRASLLKADRQGVTFQLLGEEDPSCDPLVMSIDRLVDDLERTAMAHKHPVAELR